MRRLPLENPIVTGVKATVKWISPLGGIVTGRAGRLEIEKGLFGSTMPILARARGTVPLWLTTKPAPADALIITGLKNGPELVAESEIVVSPEIKENARLGPNPRARRLNVPEPMVRRPVKFPGR